METLDGNFVDVIIVVCIEVVDVVIGDVVAEVVTVVVGSLSLK